MAKSRPHVRRTVAPPARPPKHDLQPMLPRWAPWLCGAALVAATLAAFFPAFSADFVRFDDHQYVTENKLLRDAAGLKEIWNPFATTLPQYYPLVFSSYWLEYRLWQLTPAGYHLTNVLLHALNALLVLQLVRTLGASLWLAAGAAALFALHPAQVESVVWVTERKNTLSGFFFLVAFLLYLRHRRTGRWNAYGGSLAAFSCALLSKTQTVSFPVIAAFTDWLLQRDRRLRRLEPAAVAARIAPMLALALVGAVITALVERRAAPHWFTPAPLLERGIVALTVPWFYLKTFLAPLSLSPFYPKWEIVASSPKWWVGGLAWAAVLTILVRWRQRMAALLLWGSVEFLAALIPVLAVVPFAFQQYSYVADRFLYLSCIGGGVIATAAAERLAGSARWTLRSATVLASGVLVLLACGVATHRQSTYWQSDFAFWTFAAQRNPQAYPPQINLGHLYKAKAEWPEALEHYRAAHLLQPADTLALKNYLEALQSVRGADAVVAACDEELAQRVTNTYVVHLYRAQSCELLGRRAEAAADYDAALRVTRPGSPAWQHVQQRRARLEASAPP